MKTLLAIINDPKEAQPFIRYVAGMATVFKANVHLLYVQNPNNYPLAAAGSNGAAAAQVQQNQKALAEVAEVELKEHIADIKRGMSEDIIIDYSTKIGFIAQLVQELDAKNEIDMVVLEGRDEDSFWKQTSNNLGLVDIVTCPVWIIPQNQVFESFNEIVYATDYKEEDINGLKKLIDLTKSFSPDIDVLHVTDSADFEKKVKRTGFLEILHKQLNYRHLKLKVLSDKAYSDIADLFNDFSERVKANLLVLIKENTTLLEKIFHSDSARKIIKKANIPVLIYHEQQS